MARRRFTGEEVAKVLIDMGYQPVDRTGSHLKLRYVHPENPDDIRIVTVPIASGELRQDTLRSIADQCDADDFDEWCQWIEDHL